MTEYTPDNSVYDDVGTDGGGDASAARTVLRGANALLHLVVCVLLLAIMAMFLSQRRGAYVKNMT